MASEDRWATVGAALRGDITRGARGNGRRRRAESADGGGARARRAVPTIDEIIALRGKRESTDVDRSAGGGAEAFARIRQAMATRAGLSVNELRGVPCRPELSVAEIRTLAARGRGANSTARPAPKAPRTVRSLSPDEVRRLQKRCAELGLGAMHEAAHSVVAWHLGLDVTRASLIGQHGGGESHVRFLPGRTDGRPDESYLAVLFAGVRGEQLHPNWEDEFLELWPHEDDCRLAEAYIEALGLWPKDEVALRDRVVAKADELLARYADDHLRLTQALVRERTVSGPMLQRILSGSAR